MSIRVSLKNVGPLNEATAVIRPLTILVGTNNTGKTFFATVLHKVVDSATYPVSLRHRQRRPADLPEELSFLVGRSRRASPGQLSFAERPEEFSRETLRWASDYLDEALNDYAFAVRASVEYAFGVEAAELRRRTSSGRRSPGSWIEISCSTAKWTVRVHLDDNESEVEIPDPAEWLDQLVKTAESSRSERNFDAYERLMGYYPGGAPGLFDDWPSQSIHLPAGRTGIMQSYQVLAGTVVRQSAAAGIRPIQVATLPGTSADFLSLLLSLSNGRQGPTRRRRSAKALVQMVDDLEAEHRLEIIVDDVPGEAMSSVFAVTPEGRFPLARTSSMVSELAPILLTLRHSIATGDQLVIDEPEAHLHPAMQRTIAAFFAGLSRHRIQLIITTHSDFLVGELNNMIRASNVDGGGKQGVLALGAPVASDAVAALRFERRHGGCYAVELLVDPFDGIDESTFGDVIESLYNESVALSDLKTEND